MSSRRRNNNHTDHHSFPTPSWLAHMNEVCFLLGDLVERPELWPPVEEIERDVDLFEAVGVGDLPTPVPVPADDEDGLVGELTGLLPKDGVGLDELV